MIIYITLINILIVVPWCANFIRRSRRSMPRVRPGIMIIQYLGC